MKRFWRWFCARRGHSWMIFQATFCQVRSGDVGGQVEQVCRHCGTLRMRYVSAEYVYREARK